MSNFFNFPSTYVCENLKQYYDKKVYDIIDLEKQLNFKKSNCLFPYKWISYKQLLYDKLKRNALETAYNSLGVVEKSKNDLENIENIVYTEDSTVKLIFTPSQERVVQYDIVFAVKLKVLPSTKKEPGDEGFLSRLKNLLYDGSSLITGNFPSTIKMVSVSGYTIGKVNYDDALIDIKQNILYDSSKIIK